MCGPSCCCSLGSYGCKSQNGGTFKGASHLNSNLSKQEESGSQRYHSERLIAYYCSSFYFCLRVALPGRPLGCRGAGLIIWLQPIYPSSLSLAAHRALRGDRQGSGPGGKRLCISVINLQAPAPRQREIADFFSVTQGQSAAHGGPHSKSAGAD